MPPLSRSAWRSALSAFAAAVLALGLLYRASFLGMAEIWWRSQTFAHCLLVPPIVLWLVWRKRAALQACTPRPLPWLLVPMATVTFAWLLGDLAGVNAVTHAAATALLVLLVPLLLGGAVARVLAFPLVFVFFMVPIGEFLMPTLMEWTATFTVWALSHSGVPVYREGLQFIIPTGAWSVVEACSGIRYLIASLMVGTLFAYLSFRSLKRRLLFCAVAVLVPIVANWLRAYMIVMIGHLSGNRLAVGVDHLIYGWVFFGVVIGAMFFIGTRWAESPAPDRPAGPVGGSAGGAAPPAAVPWLALALAALMLAAPHVTLGALDRADPNPVPALSLPALDGTGDPAQPEPVLRPVTAGAAAEASRVYGVPGGDVTVHVAFWRQQGYGRKLVSSSNMLVTSHDLEWNQLTSGTATLTTGGTVLQLRSAELSNTSRQRGGAQPRRLDVRQVYWVDGSLTASNARATALGLKSRLTGRGDDGALLTFVTQGEAPITGPRLDEFVARHLPALGARLDLVSRQR